MKSKLAVLKSASQLFLFMKVSGGVMEVLEVDLNSVKLWMVFFSPFSWVLTQILLLRSYFWHIYVTAAYVLYVCICLKLRNSEYLHPPALKGLTQWALQEKLADQRAVQSLLTRHGQEPWWCSECGREGLVLQENKISFLPLWVGTGSTSFSVEREFCLSCWSHDAVWNSYLFW